MTARTTVTICLGAWALVASALLLAESKGSLDARRARDVIRRLGGGELEKERVRIRSITPGTGGTSAVVEAQIETTFRFARDGEEWRAAEIRVGDRQWESLELVAEAVRREKIRRTTALLQRLGEALETYRRERGNYVVAEDAAVLVDHLSPRYLNTPVRFDLWDTPIGYRGTAGSYRLSSAGPDRQPGTPDDLVLESGARRPGSE